MRVWYRMHESELENGLHHVDNARAHASYMLPQGKALNVPCIIVYEMYQLPNIY